jgi:hypothetical protein
MSAEERRIPEGLERALADLAKVTVKYNLDPGRVIMALMRLLEWKRDVWPTLTPEQQRAVRAELARYKRQLNQGREKPRSAPR